MHVIIFLIILILLIYNILSKSSFIKNLLKGFKDIEREFTGKSKYQPKDFETSLLLLSSVIIKADGVINHIELNFVRNYFVESYGKEKANESFRKFKSLIVKQISIREICNEIRRFMPYQARVQLLRFLFDVALADGSVAPAEELEIRKIASYLFIKQMDYIRLRSVYFRQSNSNQERYSSTYSDNSNYEYEILGLDPNSTNEDIKKTYRTLVKKYHPDRLHDATNEELIIAKEKFQKIQNAYEAIKQKRGL